METRHFLEEIPPRQKPIRCFVRDCKSASGHLTRFKYGSVTLQVCLCETCLRKSRESILRGLGITDTKDLGG